jgi:hypothetical protein
MRVIITNPDKTIMVSIFTGNARLVEEIQAEANSGHIEIAKRHYPNTIWGPPTLGEVSVDR